jgi:predicted esterase
MNLSNQFKHWSTIGIGFCFTAVFVSVLVGYNYVHGRSGGESPVPSQLPIVLLPTSGLKDRLVLKDWYVVGPMKMEAPSYDVADNDKPVALHRDQLQALGLAETALSETAYLTIPNRAQQIGSSLGTIVRGDSKSSPVIILKQTGNVVFYAACVLFAQTQTKVALIAGSDQGITIWQNNQLILSTSNDRNADYRPDNFNIPIILQQGRNLLVVKVDNKLPRESTGFGVSLVPLSDGINRAERLNYDFLSSNIVDSGSYLQPLLDFYEHPVTAQLYISDTSGHVLFKSQFQTNSDPRLAIPKLKDGLYRCAVSTPTEHRESDIYVGSIEAAPATIEVMLAHKSLSDPTAMEAQLLLYRLKQLLLPVHRQLHELDWQDRAIWVVKELDALITAPFPNKMEFLLKAGFHAVTFRSQHDNQIHSYAIYLPISRPPLRLPVAMLVTPPPPPNGHPFIMSQAFSDWRQTLYLKNWANSYGMALVFPEVKADAKGDIVEGNYFEVLDDIATRYGADRDHTYLGGFCNGGQQALELGAHFPSRFVAIWVYGPNLSSLSTQEMMVWGEELKTVPILVQIGAYDIPSAKGSELFVKACKNSGGECELNVLPDAGHSVYFEHPYEAMGRFFDSELSSQRVVHSAE